MRSARPARLVLQSRVATPSATPQRFQDFTKDSRRFQDFTKDFTKISRFQRRFQDFKEDFKISVEISAVVYEISASGGPLGPKILCKFNSVQRSSRDFSSLILTVASVLRALPDRCPRTRTASLHACWLLAVDLTERCAYPTRATQYAHALR